MLASELAEQLGVDPSAMTRRLGLYYAESGTRKQRMLDATTVEAMRQVQQLLDDNQARTAREAVQRVVGTWVAPVPATSAQEILQQLEAIEAKQSMLVEQVGEIHAYLAVRMNRNGNVSRDISTVLEQLPD